MALFSFLGAKAQRDCGLWLNEVPLVADTAANSLFVTIEPNVSHALKGTLRWDESRYQDIKLNDTVLENGKNGNLDIPDWTVSAAYTLTVTNGESRQWTLVFSTLPFIVIDCPLEEMSANYSISKDNENHTRKYPGYLSVIDARCRTKQKDSQIGGLACFNSEIMIRPRGATSGSKAKKSFNMELVKDGESQDVHLLGYRKDDDWILASEYTDYSRMRNRVMMDLWTAVDKLPYETDNRYQCNGTQGEFVEVFVNGSYYGLMCFTDKIDRKKLNLKKTKEATDTTPEVKRGLLWKAIWECGETYLSGYTDRPANNSFLWPYIESKDSYGWEQKYPDDTVTQAFFDPICDIIDYLRTDNTDFNTHYTDKLYEENVIDFILFVQAFQLLDNQKKNYYLSVRNRDKEAKYLFTLWDLDGSIGRYAGGDETGRDIKQMAWGEKLGYHHMIHRFKARNIRPDDFATKMNNRWQYLSTHQLSLKNVRAVMEKYANLFATSGAWERERARWLSTYKNSKKIAATPQDEVEYMMSFLEDNYAIFNQEMASATWTHDEYNEAEYTKEITPSALYIIGNDITSQHEDNTVTLPGTVQQEFSDGISTIDYKDGMMTVTREDAVHEYPIDGIKEVRTNHTGIYPTPAFIPDSLKHFFNFETRYAPSQCSMFNAEGVASWKREGLARRPEGESQRSGNGQCSTPKGSRAESENEVAMVNVQRIIEVGFTDGEATVNGNLAGIAVAVEGDSVSITTELEGIELLVSGQSENGRINLYSQHPCKLAAAEAGTLLSGITANCDLTVCTDYALNFYNEAFNGKCIVTSGDVTIEDGSLYFLMTGSGTLTDADFLNNPTLGARAVMANNININGGQLFIKTLGHNGAVGLAAAKNITINGGNHYIATYDDPLKAGSSVNVNGGFTFATSLTNDGLDSKGDLFVNGGIISTYSPEGAEAAFDVNHFYCNGGTVIGVGYKSDQPMADKSAQTYIRLYKNKDVKRYVKIADAEGNELAVIETPSYPTLTILYSSPLLQKGNTYTLFTGDTPENLIQLTTIKAE